MASRSNNRSLSQPRLDVESRRASRFEKTSSAVRDSIELSSSRSLCLIVRVSLFLSSVIPAKAGIQAWIHDLDPRSGRG